MNEQENNVENNVEFNNLDKLLIEPVQYYVNLSSKNIRVYLLHFLVKFLQLDLEIDQNYINNIRDITSIMHNASLVIDDIQDNSLLRRNNDCAHIKYGIPLSINAGYLTIFKVLNELNKKPEFSEQIKHKIVENIYYAHIGQGMDIYNTVNKIIPTLEEYNIITKYKTGLIFVNILDLLMGKTKNHIIKQQYNKLNECLIKFGLFYQIRDDYINLVDPVYWKEKGFCQDFDEEKISYLITYCNTNKLENYELINLLLKMPNKTIKDKIELLMLMKNNNLLDIVYYKLEELQAEILSVLNMYSIFSMLPFHMFDENDLYDLYNI